MYIGSKPADKVLTASDITDGIISSAKIADGTIVNDDVNASAAIVASKLSGVGGDLSFGGDTFGADKTIGSNDTYSLSFETDGTERLKLHSDGRGLSQFTAKCWVNYNGTGTVAIRDSHNVSSITDNGTGSYDVNFTSNVADANFLSVGSSTKGGGGPTTTNSTNNSVGEGRNTNYCTMETYQGDGVVRKDSAFINVLVFGD